MAMTAHGDCRGRDPARYTAGRRREREHERVKRVRASLFGALAGGIAALVLTPIFVGLFAVGTLDVLDGRAVIEASTGSMYLLVVVLGLIGGLLISGVAYAYAAETEPDSQRFPVGWMLPIGAVVAALFAYATLRFGVGAVGDIRAGVVTISAARMVVVVLIMGVVSGGITAAVVDALARPSLIGFEGEAVPESTGALIGEMVRAIGAPVIALIVGAAFAVALSQVLLEFAGTSAVVIFSVVGALVLGGAALIASAPWDRTRSQ
jgi:hypothetical protein